MVLSFYTLDKALFLFHICRLSAQRNPQMRSSSCATLISAVQSIMLKRSLTFDGDVEILLLKLVSQNHPHYYFGVYCSHFIRCMSL